MASKELAEASASETPEDIAAPPEAVNMTDEEELDAIGDKDQSDSGKLKTLLGILKRMIGVKDMAAIRLSLPANLLEPVPNLEYWTYLDRCDLLTTVGDFDDPMDRMLAALRFALTKELKYVRGKVCKPYNSILGEHFRAHWDVDPPIRDTDGDLIPVMKTLKSEPSSLQLFSTQSGGAASIRSGRREASSVSARPPIGRVYSSATVAEKPTRPEAERAATTQEVPSSATVGRKGFSKFLGRKGPASSAASTNSSEAPTMSSNTPSLTSTKQTSVESGKPDTADDDDDGDSVTGTFKTSQSSSGQRRMTFITEQVSHHPPISSFFCECKEAGVQLCGVDQLSAKFTGTSVRVFSGEQNQGIFIKLLESASCGVPGEEYQITHPTASVNGMFRGALWVAISDSVTITCRGGVREGETPSLEDGELEKRGVPKNRGKRLKSIVEYKEESWVMKAKYALEGVIYEYGPEEETEEWTKVKQVPQDRVLCTFEGTWKGRITFKRKGEKESRLLVDLEEIDPIDKQVRPLAAQDSLESRRIWEPVTTAIIAKDYGAATKAKQEIEQKQRDVAAARKRKGEEFVPQFFDADISDGRPRLTEEGRKAIDGEADLEGY